VEEVIKYLSDSYREDIEASGHSDLNRYCDYMDYTTSDFKRDIDVELTEHFGDEHYLSADDSSLIINGEFACSFKELMRKIRGALR
jgi:hypothetical protein